MAAAFTSSALSLSTSSWVTLLAFESAFSTLSAHFDAWVATRPREEPQRPAIAVRHAPVQARGQYGSRPRRGQGRRVLPARGSFIRRADDYSLAVVLFASALFFAGISARLRATTTRVVALGLGCALFAGSVIRIATFPVSLSV